MKVLKKLEQPQGIGKGLNAALWYGSLLAWVSSLALSFTDSDWNSAAMALCLLSLIGGATWFIRRLREVTK